MTGCISQDTGNLQQIPKTLIKKAAVLSAVFFYLFSHIIFHLLLSDFHSLLSNPFAIISIYLSYN